MRVDFRKNLLSEAYLSLILSFQYSFSSRIMWIREAPGLLLRPCIAYRKHLNAAEKSVVEENVSL